MSQLARGLVLGFSIAAPVGPIGLLCIRRTLGHGRSAGFAAGLGAAVADSLYACVAGFGLTAVSNALVAGRGPLRLVGGAFLVYLGFRAFRSTPRDDAEANGGRSLGKAFASTFVLTITNPATILSFVAAFAALGLGQKTEGYGAAVSLVAGVFVGSAAWWLGLSQGVGLFRRRVSSRVLVWINRGSGVVILGFGVAALVSLALGA